VSLRVLTGLLVAVAVVLVPLTNALVMQWWPPPDFRVHVRSCSDENGADVPCGGPESGERRFMRQREAPPGGGPGERNEPPDLPPPPGLPGFGATVAGFAGGPGPFVRVVRFGGPDATPLRQHFLIVNLISFVLVVVLAVLAASLLLRRPFRALLAAIGDIERGASPPAWAFSGPAEFRRIGSALEQLGRQLRSNLQERELMLAGLSHDLRSPLARIQAALELRASDGESWSDTLRDVREINHIVGQCIDFARDGQDEPLQNASLDGIAAALLGADAGPDLKLDLAAPQALPLRVAAVRRALRNLVDNAHLHGALPVVVATHIDGAEAVLSVSDAGAGIAPEAWDQLRRPFARGSHARNPAGCGLGLAIVQRVAGMHGGRLCLRPAAGGRPFAIELRLPLRVPG
jgi:signal transduction histidine kinase